MLQHTTNFFVRYIDPKHYLRNSDGCNLYANIFKLCEIALLYYFIGYIVYLIHKSKTQPVNYNLYGVTIQSVWNAAGLRGIGDFLYIPF